MKKLVQCAIIYTEARDRAEARNVERKIYMLKFQTICRALNSALKAEDITANEAITQMCSLMPETFKEGQWSSPEHNNILVLKSRLVVWEVEEFQDIRLRDLENYLQGN